MVKTYILVFPVNPWSVWDIFKDISSNKKKRKVMIKNHWISFETFLRIIFIILIMMKIDSDEKFQFV